MIWHCISGNFRWHSFFKEFLDIGDFYVACQGYIWYFKKEIRINRRDDSEYVHFVHKKRQKYVGSLGSDVDEKLTAEVNDFINVVYNMKNPPLEKLQRKAGSSIFRRYPERTKINVFVDDKLVTISRSTWTYSKDDYTFNAEKKSLVINCENSKKKDND